MILLCGIRSEPPMARVTAALAAQRQHFVFFDQRQFEHSAVRLSSVGATACGTLVLGNAEYRLEDFSGVFVRLMDYQALPEFVHAAEGSEPRTHCAALHERLCTWFELTDAAIMNRPSAMCSNNSKPYQAQLIRENGFEIPETLITSDPEAVRVFERRHGRVIYKSTSGVRSIVQTLTEADSERLEKIRWCPTQFQAYVEGFDVRVHVAGDETFATRIHSDAVDYRYAQAQTGEPAELEAFELTPELAERCLVLSRAMDLPLAGIDLRIHPDSRVFCFEVNPCPGFSYYESHTGQPIAAGIARYLAHS